MSRIVLGVLVGALTLAHLPAAAQAGPKKKPARAAAQEAPESTEIAEAMGDLKWGMTRDQVLEHFTKQIRDKYRPLLARTTGALEEDKVRAQQRDELGKLKSSVVDFKGRKTGWDVSFLKGEFTHHNGESLFVVSDETSENYYFFIKNKLWKWYKAFKTDVFEGKSFEEFAEAIQARYGRAQLREAEAPGGGKQRWLEWQDPTTRLRAVDNKQFYGFYSLVFEDKATLRKLPELRTSKPAERARGNALVESVTRDDAAQGDANPDVVDRITGKVRRRPDAPAAGKPGDAKKPAPSESGGVTSQDDPLKGL